MTVAGYRNGSEKVIKIRAFSPLVIFGIILSCYSLFGFMSLFDRSFTYEDNPFWPVFWGIAGTGIIFFLKNLIAPFMIAVALAWAVFQYAVNDIWSLVPIYSFIIEALLFWAPSWIQVGYIWVSLATLVVSSLTILER